MIQLTESVFAVVVPSEAKEFKVCNSMFPGNNRNIAWTNGFKVTDNAFDAGLIELIDGKWSILGTVTHESIDFDVEPYVEKFKVWSGVSNVDVFKNYEKGNKYNFLLPEFSFRSLIQSKAITYEKLVIVERISK